MSLYLCGIVGFVNYSYYNADIEKMSLSSYLTMLLNNKDTETVARIIAEDFPEQTYGAEVVLEVKEATSEVRANLQAIMSKFDHVNVCCSKAIDIQEQDKIAHMLQSLDFTDGT